MRRSLCVGVLLLLTVLCLPAFAANSVSGLTISGSPVGGTMDQATGTITVNRDPGSFNSDIAIDIIVPQGVGLICKYRSTGTSYGCYLKAGETSMDVGLTAGLVSTDTSVNIRAYADGNPGDPGITTQMTIQAMRSSVSMSPSTLLGGQMSAAHVTITNGTPASDITVTLSQSPSAVGTFAQSAQVVIPKGNASADLDFTAYSVSTQKSATVTPSIGPSPGTAAITVNTGSPTASTETGCCGRPPEVQIGMPIDVLSGNTWVQERDYSVPGLGALAVVRTWNSLWTVNSPPWTAGLFGHSWTSNLEEHIQVVNPTTTKYWMGDGKVIQYAYDSLNQVYVLVSPPEEHIALVYDPIFQQYTVQYKNGDRKLFNSAGYLTAILDRNGNQTTLTYDGSNRVTQVTDPAGRTLTFTYGSPSSTQVQSVADSVGTIATYTYDASNRLTQVTYADTYITFSYDSNSLLLNVKDSGGKVLEAHTYDGSRRGLTSQKANGVEAVSVSYSTNYTYFTNSVGGASQLNFNQLGTGYYLTGYWSSGCATCSLLPGGHSTSYMLDGVGNRTQITDPNGNLTYQTFDSLGNLTSSKRSLGSNNYSGWQYTYNNFAEILTATDPLGNTTTNTYDANGNLLSTTTPSPDGVQAGSTTSFTYDSHGLLLTVTDPLNHTTTMTYTTAGLVATVTDAQNNVTTYAYDARGNRTSVTDALNHQTTFAYDLRNRLTTITYPDLTTTTFAYDIRGRRTSVTDGNNKTTTYAYDDADRLTSVTDAASNVTRYGYNNESQLTSITDAANHTTSFTYTNGFLSKTTFPSTLYETYSYDYNGNLSYKTDRKGQTTHYYYDALDRVYYAYLGSYISYYYDNASHLTKVVDGSNTYQFAYDNIGRLTQTTTNYSFLSGHTYTVSYSYDAAGNRTSMTDPASGVTNYSYDSLNRLTNLTDFNSNSFGFSYDALSRRTQMTRPNGVSSNYSYDNLSRLLSVLHQVGGTTIDGATYTYDNAGNRLSKLNQTNAVTENYTYDQIYQLTQVVQNLNNTTEAYTYDAVGNRLSTVSDSGWSYDSSNHLTSRPGVTYTYDNNGNTATKVDSNGTTTYAWDYLNRLTSVTLPGGGGTVTFKYDPFGRRIQRVSPTGTTNYLYDGANSIEEVDATGTVLARYPLGPGVDQPLGVFTGGATKFYQADGLGSITALADISGSATDAYVTDAFGKTTSSAGSTRNPFRYTGRELDADTGLYYYRARYYDPSTGRFLSEDPTKFDGGINFYSYVRNDPTDLSDPSGLRPKGRRKPSSPRCDAVIPADRPTAMLAQLVYAEGNGSSEGDLAIASVVVNELNYGNPKEFGATLVAVIHNGKFAALGNALYNSVSNQAKVCGLNPRLCQRYKNAALAAIVSQTPGGTNTDALFYFDTSIGAPRWLRNGIQDGSIVPASVPGGIGASGNYLEVPQGGYGHDQVFFNYSSFAY